jgi:hypothetical protein
VGQRELRMPAKNVVKREREENEQPKEHQSGTERYLLSDRQTVQALIQNA